MLLRKYFRFSPAAFSLEWVSNPATLSTSPVLKYKTYLPHFLFSVNLSIYNKIEYIELHETFLVVYLFLNKKARIKNILAYIYPNKC